MLKIINKLVEIPMNNQLNPADRKTRGGHKQALYYTCTVPVPYDE